MDSQPIQRDQALAVLSGNARQILMMERTCLNFICRLSGISTLTHQFVQRISETDAIILDTRKTLPGWRRLEKYAVACGGGANHRMGLYDAIMIKDNHMAMYGSHIDNHKQSITDAIHLARQWIEKNKGVLPNGENTIVQIEVDTLDQLRVALESEPDIILLDNMDAHRLSRAVELRNATRPRVLLEASGGVNLENVFEIAMTGIERISVGAITHAAVNLDIGLDWQIGSLNRFPVG
jgi:nicotinate-nucleotide pyrophosphorylase (carboxylating)